MERQEIADLLRQHGVDVATLTHFCDTPAGPFYGLTVLAAQALDSWSKVRRLAPMTGYWPVITRSFAALGYDMDAISDLRKYLRGSVVSRVLAAAEGIDPVAWIETRLAEDAANVEETGDDSAAYRMELEGNWPADAEPRTRFTLPTFPSLDPHLVPTSIPWQVPAYYRFGGTGTPLPEEHVALLRYWYDLYGVELVSFRGDLIELMVWEPPRTRETALALAWQQYGYCRDAVIQRSGTVAALAATLLGATAWSFWWD